MRRRWLALLVLVALVSAGTAFSQRPQDPISRAAGPYRYQDLAWEAQALPPALLLSLTPWRQPNPEAPATKQHIEEYFTAARQAAAAYQDLRQLVATEPASPRRAAMAAGLAERESARGVLAEAATWALQAQLESVIIAERLGPGLPGRSPLPIAWPPVRFVLEPPPRVLILSPRDRILLERQIPLRPQMTLAEAEALETAVEAEGHSALVEELGGFASYPAAVPFGYSLETTLTLAAHEWVHHYLAFRPLGWSYEDSPKLRSANETLADLVGQELAQAVLQRYHGRSPRPTDGTPAGEPEPGRFDFGAFMRATRLEVDARLAAGQVTEAEAYMESQREVLVSHGYSIRRLNQAYFAFHGTYATGPVSVDPLGGQLRDLRARSTDLRTFLLTVSAVGRDAELEDLLPSP